MVKVVHIHALSRGGYNECHYVPAYRAPRFICQLIDRGYTVTVVSVS
jgi:hypothetical protein